MKLQKKDYELKCKRASPSNVHRAAVLLGKDRQNRWKGSRKTVSKAASYLGRQNCGRMKKKR